MNPMLRYGLLAGLLLCLPMFLPIFVFGPDPAWMRFGEAIGYTSMVLCLSATWFAMRREQRRRGPLIYGQALAIGVGVSAVAGLVFGLATWLLYLAMGPALPEGILAFYAEQIRAAGDSPEQTAARLAELEAMRPMLFNLPLQAAVMAATVFLIGLVESLLWAWLVRRQPVSEPAAGGAA